MFKLIFSQSKYLTLAVASLLLMSSNAHADIYKWRNARGVMQYSDKPPMVSFTKATRSEILNALQSKDVCTLLPNTLQEKTSLAFTRTQKNAFFFGLSNSTTNNNMQNFGALGSSNSISTMFGLYKGALVHRFTTGSTPNVVNAVAPSVSAVATSNPTKVVLPVKSSAVPVIPAVTSAPPKTTVAQAAATVPPASFQAPNIVQVALMPAVDITKNTADAIGLNSLQVKPTSELPLAGQSGAVRIPCTVAKMSNDDPLVYPNQPGAAHHHTFFGNTSTNAKSDLNNMASIGNSTCSGGTMNRSAYWMPSMIDTVTHAPIMPTSAIFYYKTGYTVPAEFINPPPKGLRMIAGNSKGTSGADAGGLFTCIDAKGSLPWASSIPNCPVGSYLQMNIGFPQCWDGINLDSPDHKSHMAYPDGRLPTANKCPATHPIAIPNISVNFNFTITKADQTKKWRLASDNYSDTLPGGFSSHADWVNGWNEQIMASIVKNCLRKELDAHAHLLCDGRTFYQ